MKARKAALRLLVSAMLVVGLLPVAALAADGEQAGEVKVPAQAQVEDSAQDQTKASADDQAQTADAQGTAPVEKAEATDSTTDQVNPSVVAATDAADEPMTVAFGTEDLYWYALIPGKTMDSGEDPDQTWFGLGVSTISGVYSPGIYSSGKVITQYGSISEVAQDPSKPLYPDITFEGTTYKYAKAGAPEASMQGYYTLSPVRVTVASGANAGNNNYNSTKGSLVKTYHYDHVMVLNEKDYYTVNYEVQYAGESEWVALKDYAQRVENDYSESKLKKPARDSAVTPETQTVDGVTYQFDGWYKDKACTQKANFDGTITQNTTYYAHYVPRSGSLSVSKSVTGSAANVDQSFTFEFRCADLAGKTFAAEGVTNSVAFNDQGVATVQLKHGQSVTLTKVPAGSQVAVHETGLSGNARTSSTVSINNGAAETVATNGQTVTTPKTVTVASNQTQTLAFTNSAEAVSATGVSLDAGPMAGLFAVAAAGAGALAASGYKCRKREQDAWKE